MKSTYRRIFLFALIVYGYLYSLQLRTVLGFDSYYSDWRAVALNSVTWLLLFGIIAGTAGAGMLKLLNGKLFKK